MTPAAPASASVTPQDAVGLWRISAADEARSCLLALNLKASDGGYEVMLEECRLPDLSKASSWRLTADGLEFRAADGVVLVRLRRETLDAYRAVDGGPAYRMERAPLA
ncbi:AprI/Inh family metalloprotease inhibitor [Brevundimonas sp.]|uniref:AprI/Inh family metalloprotease inhibitor n=1 Tax=Brevundimonas sp. TaxID=1871086 RepID=UPI00289DFC3C|nr:AprI/Inh family metalloprotease inhibitor [Brevundimonas sp.]